MASPNSSIATPVPFPQPYEIANQETSNTAAELPSTNGRERSSTNASTVSGRLRSATGKLMEASPPPGMWAATGTAAAKAPSLSDIRTGSFGSGGWNEHVQRSRAGSRASQRASGSRTSTTATATSEQPEHAHASTRRTSSNNALDTKSFPALAEEETRQLAEQNTLQDNATSGTPSKQSSDTATEHADGDRPRQPKRTSSGRVCQSRDSRCVVLTTTVHKWLRPAPETSLEAILCYRSQELLEVVPDSRRLPHHTIQSQRRCMGWHAVSPSLQRRACNVQAYL
jgi:hypothetical protein